MIPAHVLFGILVGSYLLAFGIVGLIEEMRKP